ncbi:hypothetical protein REPUB_Repub14bG0125000 [Reevesia pubescens]
MFADMVGGDGMSFAVNTDPTETKRARVTAFKCNAAKRNEATSLPDQLDEAANYIKRLQTNLERMKERKDSLMGVERRNTTTSRSSSGPKSPQIEIQEMGSSLVIGLTTRSNSQFIFNETIRILHEEGAEIVNASFSVVDDAVFHTIHLTVGESAPDYRAARISERLKKFVNDADA